MPLAEMFGIMGLVYLAGVISGAIIVHLLR